MKALDFIVILGSFFIITTSTVYGQEAKDSDLAKQSQNPLGTIISAPFENNFNFGIGPFGCHGICTQYETGLSRQPWRLET